MVFNMTEQEWDDVIRVHLKGTFNTTKFASAHWRSLRGEAGPKPIIQLTPVSRPHRAPRQPHYPAAQIRLPGLTHPSAHTPATDRGSAYGISPCAASRTD